MTGIVKTDQIQGAQSTTVTVPTGNTLAVTSNATVGGTLDVTGALTGSSATLTTADNTAQLELVSTDADAGIGPHQVFYRNSASPADGDLLCELDFRGRNDNSQDVNYATVNVKANDVSDGTEDGEYILQVMTAGSVDTTMHIKPTEIVFNEDSIDRDFRVESNTIDDALFVQGSNGFVGVGTQSPSSPLDVEYIDGGVQLKIGRTNTTAGSAWFGADANALNIGVGAYGGAGGNVTTPNGIKVDASGRVTKPYNPSFRAMGTTGAYITTSPVQFNSVSGSGGHNIGNHYNTSNYRFTAPVAGRYLFHVHMGIINITANNGLGYPYMRINGTSIAYSYYQFPASATYVGAFITQIFQLSASDYVDVTFAGGNATYYGNATELSFQGYLLG